MRLGLWARIVFTHGALIGVLVAVILFGIDLRVQSELHANLVRKGEALAATLAESVASAALTEDVVGVHRLLHGARRSDPAVRYAFVLDSSGRPVAHTFLSGVPRDLVDAPDARKASPAVRLLRSEEGLVYDVQAPVLGGRLGALHVGLTTHDADAIVSRARRRTVAFALAVLVAGSALAVALARSLTRPLRELGAVAARVGAGELGARASEGGPREFAALARAWNEVTDALVRRIAEIHALESYQARLLDSMGDAIRVIGPDDRVEYANALLRGDTARTGRRCSEILSNGSRPCGQCPVGRVRETGEPAFRRHEAADGTVCEVAFIPLDLPDGRRAVIERSRDVTESAKLQRRLVEVERMAALGEVAAGVAHEIGNPLDGIRGCLDVVCRSRDDAPRAEKFLGLATQGIDRIEGIVRRLTAAARPLPLRKASASLEAVCEQALVFVSVRAERHGVRIVRRFPQGVPQVEADPDALSQVVINLVLNALDAIEAKGQAPGEVVVETLVSPGGEPRAAGIRVSDNGAGIRPEIQDKVGTPFFTTKPPGKGTGLGLSVSRGLIEQHGGRLSVESRPGEGARFTVWIPSRSDT